MLMSSWNDPVTMVGHVGTVTSNFDPQLFNCTLGWSNQFVKKMKTSAILTVSFALLALVVAFVIGMSLMGKYCIIWFKKFSATYCAFFPAHKHWSLHVVNCVFFFLLFLEYEDDTVFSRKFLSDQEQEDVKQASYLRKYGHHHNWLEQKHCCFYSMTKFCSLFF